MSLTQSQARDLAIAVANAYTQRRFMASDNPEAYELYSKLTIAQQREINDRARNMIRMVEK